MHKVSVVGLGKLGLCLAASLAHRGFETIGVDIQERVVSSINSGVSPIVEPGLDELISKLGGTRLRATLSHKEAIDQTDITFVLVATPSNSDGSFSNRYVEAALKSLATAFGESEKEYHLFVISSTVMPGSTDCSFIPILEKYSGRKCNQDFAVCYNPDFVALGNVIKGFLRPDLVVIGETMPEAGAKVEAVHRQLCTNEPAISRMSIISAEIAKVCLNVYITLKVSFANSIANLCEHIPNADVDAITRAIGADKRISPYYFQGGLSFGGTCFPRDTRAYVSLAAKHGVQAELVHATVRVNEDQDQHLAEVVLREAEVLENKVVGILGLAFKPDTPVIIESPAVKLIQELLKHDMRIVVYDPLAMENTRAVFGDAIEYVHSAEESLAQSGLCVLTLRAPELKHAVEGYASARPLTVVDCWRMIEPAKLSDSVKYVALGQAHGQINSVHTEGRQSA